MSALDSQLAALPMLSAHELRLKWQDLRCGEPTAPASRDLMIREIAYKMQERAQGGLPPVVKRRLRALAAEFDAKGASALVPAPLLKPGTRLLREWGGKTHTVIVQEDGFEHGGERYQSLTQVARRITGAHWSGRVSSACEAPDMSKPGPSRSRRLSCAIYTRKSSEEGLEQEFNSLHAQREACEAYIKSQRHEGWTCLPQAYDDGGLSGATLERPALQQLLTDIRESRVDIVVCYKVDRLTRSLAEFAKIVEIFDARDVSFVSVTQQFNTTTSMGRLTLNVLLSFAQFERAVTGERIRDKIAASKKKGMWMGGVPPLGYQCRDHKLFIVPDEAETVQHIFRRYAALGSVRLLQRELAVTGIRSKSWVSPAGHRWGGKPLARGALYTMLRNRIYRGQIVHKDQHYLGEHEPIIDEPLWEDVQAELAANAVERTTAGRVQSPSLLAGLLFDREGHRMTPSHAVKKGLRYRYYVSHPLIRNDRQAAPEGLRIAAAEIERIVLSTICELLSTPGRVAETLDPFIETAGEQQWTLRRAGEAAASWSELPAPQLRSAVAVLCRRITVHRKRVDIEVSGRGLCAFLGVEPTASEATSAGSDHSLQLSVPTQLHRIGQGKRLVIDAPGAPGMPGRPDPKLIKLLVRAHDLKEKLRASPGARMADMAKQESLSPSYLALLLRLTFLAPDITRAILEGRQPAGFTAQKLVTHSALPFAWPEQREALGCV
jgi:site-specific DNA recombinase